MTETRESETVRTAATGSREGRFTAFPSETAVAELSVPGESGLRLAVDTDNRLAYYLSECCGASVKGSGSEVVCRSCCRGLQYPLGDGWFFGDERGWDRLASHARLSAEQRDAVRADAETAARVRARWLAGEREPAAAAEAAERDRPASPSPGELYNPAAELHDALAALVAKSGLLARAKKLPYTVRYDSDGDEWVVSRADSAGEKSPGEEVLWRGIDPLACLVNAMAREEQRLSETGAQ